MYNDRVKVEFHPEIIVYINKKYKGDYKKFAEDWKKTSIFSSEAAFEQFLAKPDLKKLQKDLVMQT